MLRGILKKKTKRKKGNIVLNILKGNRGIVSSNREKLELINKIDSELAMRVHDGILLAYGSVYYGFGLSTDGEFLVEIYEDDYYSGGKVKIDEFIIEIDFNIDKDIFIGLLTKEITDELVSVTLERRYGTFGK